MIFITENLKHIRRMNLSAKNEKDINLVVNLTDGWEERFAEASYLLYLQHNSMQARKEPPPC